MPSSIDEGHLRFAFDERWEVEKWDDAAAYRSGICKLEGSGAVDIAGIYDGVDYYFFEIKDYRGTPRAITDSELTLWVAHKVRDTIAGIVGAGFMHADEAVYKRHIEAWTKASATTRPRVILWIEEDYLSRLPKDGRKAALATLTDLLKTKLKWLTTYVTATNLDTSTTHGLTVSNLPGAGHRRCGNATVATEPNNITARSARGKHIPR